MLYQSDDYGKDLLSGFRKGLGASNKSKIVQTVGYDPTVRNVTFRAITFGSEVRWADIQAEDWGDDDPSAQISDHQSASSLASSGSGNPIRS